MRYDSAPGESTSRKKRRLIDDRDHEEADIQSLQVSGEQWEAAIDAATSKSISVGPSLTILQDELCNVDQDDPTRAQIADMLSILDPTIFVEAIKKREVHTCAAIAAGSTGRPSFPEEVSVELFITLVEACATHAEVPKGIDKELLVNIWWISEDEMRRTLEVTTQLNRQGADSSLSRRAGTNDRMLRYSRLDYMFFMDTFFVTKKARSTRCIQ